MQGYIAFIVVVVLVLLLLVLYPAGEEKRTQTKIDSFCANRNKRNFCGFKS